MECRCNTDVGARRIVRGNDFSVSVRVTRLVMHNGLSQREDIGLASCTGIKASLVSRAGKRTSLEYAVVNDKLVVGLDETVPCGLYGLEVTGKDAAGDDWRACLKPGEFVTVVETTGEAFTPYGDQPETVMSASPSTVSAETIAKIGEAITDAAEAKAAVKGKADKATTLAGYGITDAYTKKEADGKFAGLVPVTHAALLEMLEGGELVAGRQYRITDYELVIADRFADQLCSGPGQFDIIVTADGAGSVNCKARATYHEGDTYFEEQALEEWELWYVPYNDYLLYPWASYEGGKGVIYRMIDESGNDMAYDFKHMKFALGGHRFFSGDTDAIAGGADAKHQLGTLLGIAAVDGGMVENSAYTFLADPADLSLDGSLFTVSGDTSTVPPSSDNVATGARPSSTQADAFSLCCFNIFVGSCVRNRLGAGSRGNIIRGGHDIVMGMACALNDCGGSHNRMGDGCEGNKLADCCFISTGASCLENALTKCCNVELGDTCVGNTVTCNTGFNESDHITFGPGCDGNVVKYCRYVSFRSGMNGFDDSYIRGGAGRIVEVFRGADDNVTTQVLGRTTWYVSIKDGYVSKGLTTDNIGSVAAGDLIEYAGVSYMVIQTWMEGMDIQCHVLAVRLIPKDEYDDTAPRELYMLHLYLTSGQEIYANLEGIQLSHDPGPNTWDISVGEDDTVSGVTFADVKVGDTLVAGDTSIVVAEKEGSFFRAYILQGTRINVWSFCQHKLGDGKEKITFSGTSYTPAQVEYIDNMSFQMLKATRTYIKEPPSDDTLFYDFGVDDPEGQDRLGLLTEVLYDYTANPDNLEVPEDLTLLLGADLMGMSDAQRKAITDKGWSIDH